MRGQVGERGRRLLQADARQGDPEGRRRGRGHVQARGLRGLPLSPDGAEQGSGGVLVPKVEIVGLTKAYGPIEALAHVDLTIEDGEYVSIIGPSGCGKTTLIKCIAGIIRPSRGEIRIDGRDVSGLRPEERSVGYVFQEIALFPQMNTWENITYGPRVKGWPEDRAREIGREMLEMIGLQDRSDASPNELSGGAGQKTAVARAVSSGSTLLLLDEPLGALDAKVRTDLRYKVRK
ncbi:ATP-binding cassette domain-containing protein, partial [bacterium]